jgi:hypothetical protein
VTIYRGVRSSERYPIGDIAAPSVEPDSKVDDLALGESR